MSLFYCWLFVKRFDYFSCESCSYKTKPSCCVIVFQLEIGLAQLFFTAGFVCSNQNWRLRDFDIRGNMKYQKKRFKFILKSYSDAN